VYVFFTLCIGMFILCIGQVPVVEDFVYLALGPVV